MMVDTMVYGYVGEGAVYHPDCIRDERTGVVMDRLYSHDDDGRGLMCDVCLNYIFEPDEDYCGECDDFVPSPWHTHGEDDDDA
jgi:hypothetical protein